MNGRSGNCERGMRLKSKYQADLNHLKKDGIIGMGAEDFSKEETIFDGGEESASCAWQPRGDCLC